MSAEGFDQVLIDFVNRRSRSETCRKPETHRKPIKSPEGTWSGTRRETRLKPVGNQPAIGNPPETRRKPVGNLSETRRKHLTGPSNQDLLRYRRRKPVGNPSEASGRPLQARSSLITFSNIFSQSKRVCSTLSRNKQAG